MEESTSREKVLKKIRNALKERCDPPFPILDEEAPIFKPITEPLDVVFAEEFLRADGKFIYSESVDEFTGMLKSFILERDWPILHCYDPQLHSMLREAGIPFESEPNQCEDMKIGIIRCEYLIAQTGSIIVSSRISPGRTITIVPEILLIVAWTSQLMPDLMHAFQAIQQKYSDSFPSMISILTGAEKPKERYLFLIEDEDQTERI